MHSKVRVYNQWSHTCPRTYKEWYDDLYENKWEVVILNGLWEWEFYHQDDEFHEWMHKYEQLVYERGVKIYVIHGTNGPVMTSKPMRSLPGSATYIYFPLYWLYTTIVYGRGHMFTVNQYTNVVEGLAEKTSRQVNPDTLFLSLVNKGHGHRCYGMDRLTKDGIITNGVKSNGIIHYSWHDNLKQTDSYNFQYWEPQLTELSDPYRDNLDSYVTIPDEMHTTAFNLIFESHPHNQFWTEKTFTAIAYGKPFLIFGGQGINLDLKTFGFEIFEEVCLYPHELSQLYERRFDGYMEDILNIKQHHFGKEKELYEQLKPKALHNQNLMIDIYNNKKFIPQAIFDLMERYEVTWSDFEMAHLLVNN